MSGYSQYSTAGDGLTYHSGSGFSTKDKDIDGAPINCSIIYWGAFWYNDCVNTNPLGYYEFNGWAKGMGWDPFNNYLGSLDKIKFMIRAR